MRPKDARNARFDERRAELLARLRARLSQRDAMRPSLRELAAAAGCSVSTLNHYFGKRDDIVLAVFADSGTRGQGQFHAIRIPGSDFETSVRKVAALAWKVLTQHGVAGMLSMGMIEGMRDKLLGPAFIEHMFEPFIIALTERLDAHVARGEMRRVDTRMAALALASPLLLGTLTRRNLAARCSIRSTATPISTMWWNTSCAPIGRNRGAARLGGRMDNIEDRKSQHLAIVAAGQGVQNTRGTGFDTVCFVHDALPELAFDAVVTRTTFLGRSLSAPLMVSAMTGGPREADRINLAIAETCGAMGLALAVGSQRIAIEGRGAGGLGRELRERAPNVPILGNLGVVQLRRGMGVDEARRAVEMLEADALMLHANPLQEALQPGGDRDFSGLLGRIEALAGALPVPLGVKEVGAGLSAAVGRRLLDAGVVILDVAGVGGTSWARVEAERGDDRLRRIAAPFFDWGIPTAEAVAAMAPAMRPDTMLIASGGVRHGLDVARAIRLGADLAGQAAGALPAARDGAEALAAHLSEIVEQLRIAMFCTGSPDLAALRRAPLA